MKKLVLSAIFLTAVITSQAQDTASTADSAAPKYWKVYGGISINLNQVGLYRWQGGGEPSFSATLLYKGNWDYAKDKNTWVNYVDIAYGIIKQGTAEQSKSDDRWELGSKYGHQISESWDLNVFATLRSQFTSGFDKDNTALEISNLMAPGYLLSGIGLNYKKGDWLNINLSPVTSKSTFVLDSAIANLEVPESGRGKYGNDLGSSYRQELGAFAKITIKKEILENVILSTKADFFTDYLYNFGAIDVNWNLILLMKVNKFITATVTMDLIYDEDIAIILEKNNAGEATRVGPAVQFKETVGVGLTYTY
jgi:hypothetical protein